MSYTVQVTMTAHQVWKRFKEYNRAENFTEAGLEAILNNMQEASEGDGVLVIDVIAICGEYSEDNAERVAFDLGLTGDLCLEHGVDSVHEIDDSLILEAVQEHTWAELLWNGNIVYRNI